MNHRTQVGASLFIWIVALIAIGGVIGSLTKPEISGWYSALNRSSWTPPNNAFPIAWTILYGIIGACGWVIWRTKSRPNTRIIKTLYLSQLILNWSWTPCFFHYHLIGVSLVLLVAMDILTCALIGLAFRKMKVVSLLMMPYLSWILFATYLNFYIWRSN